LIFSLAFLFAAPSVKEPTLPYPVWPDNHYYAYNFLHTELNTFQFYNRHTIEPLFRKLKTADKNRVSILHIGDSHIQADVFTGEIRERMQATFGSGGRGLVFPYSTARTHAAIDYVTDNTGRWIYARNIEATPPLDLGVTGIASRTEDANASFRFHFRNTIRPEFKRLRIFCKRSVHSYDLLIKTPEQELNVNVFDSARDGSKTVNVVDVNLLQGSNEISFYIQKTDTLQTEFEIYGISIENPQDKGVLYHSVGINGAGYFSLLRENLLEEQLRYLAPDAIILDVGANDFYRGGFNEYDFNTNMKQILAILRNYKRDIPIILSCSQDIYRGGYSIPDCATFSEFISEFSKNNYTAFYDWYWIAGGRYSMLKWNSNLLSNRDLVHLSGQGYKLKGQLITEAFQSTYNWFQNQDTAKLLVYNIDSLQHPPVDSNALKNPPQYTIQYKWVYHKVWRGQTIFSVASYYGVTAYQIRVWNRLRNNYLWIGQLLKIYAPFKVPVENKPVSNINKDSLNNIPHPVTPKPNPTPPPKNTPNPAPTVTPKPKISTPPVKPAAPNIPKAIYYKVKSGETLFGIAKKFGTSTTAIQKLNGLRSTLIKPGQVLRVK
jgi:LysM repeat protein/lysophospholipase L1-like esterase